MHQSKRNSLLGRLFSPLQTLTGIGPALAERLKSLMGENLLDACRHLPINIKARRPISALREAKSGETITVVLKVIEHRPPYNRRISPRSPYSMICQDKDGWHVDIIYFHHYQWDVLQRRYVIGQEYLVVGVCDEYRRRKRIVHPEFIGSAHYRYEWEGRFPVYPTTQGLTQKLITKVIAQALEAFPPFPEWINQSILNKFSWNSLKETLYKLHHPTQYAELEPSHPLKQRLAYDELLAHQLALRIARHHHQKQPGRSFQPALNVRAKVLEILPFSLTPGQRQALDDIDHDMAASTQMLRLLQGDVGSGKTIVSFLSALNAVKAGAQAAFLTPTEVLARQHFTSLLPLAKHAGVTLRLLTGRDKERQQTLNALADGSLSIIIGTHALLQEDVLFNDLGMIVIDEQHRFGVDQRLTLSEKGRNVDCLLMSATPIPRSLLLTFYGDLPTSSIKDKPVGRPDINTKTLPLERLEDVFQAIDRAIKGGQKIYWICPLVEESEALDIAAAIERFDALNLRFPQKVGLMHGQMKGEQKDKAMRAFQQGNINLLVATTVIEVGIDVPDATIIVIEHAERFGLAQLHQLRGRVGRSALPSSCLLLYASPLSEIAKARLQIMRSTNDGFLIAEEDLRLRGSGDLLGTRQSGWPKFLFAQYAAHKDLLLLARQDAEEIMAADPHLTTERGRALHLLLNLFDHHKTIGYIRGG